MSAGFMHVHKNLTVLMLAPSLLLCQYQTLRHRFIKVLLKDLFSILLNDCNRNNPKYWDRQAFANSVDPDQLPQNVASDQGLHCLPYIKQYF